MIMKAMQFCWLAFISSLAFSLCAAAEENQQVADKDKTTTESKSETDRKGSEAKDRKETADAKDNDNSKAVKVVKYDDSDSSSEHKHGGNMFTRFWIHTIGGNIGAGLKGRHHDDNSDSNDK
jgi:hypothetical protein